MKKTLFLTLIFLTACTSTSSSTPVSYFNDLPVPVILTIDSTSEQI